MAHKSFPTPLKLYQKSTSYKTILHDTQRVREWLKESFLFGLVLFFSLLTQLACSTDAFSCHLDVWLEGMLIQLVDAYQISRLIQTKGKTPSPTLRVYCLSQPNPQTLTEVTQCKNWIYKFTAWVWNRTTKKKIPPKYHKHKLREQ